MSNPRNQKESALARLVDFVRPLTFNEQRLLRAFRMLTPAAQSQAVSYMKNCSATPGLQAPWVYRVAQPRTGYLRKATS